MVSSKEVKVGLIEKLKALKSNTFTIIAGRTELKVLKQRRNHRRQQQLPSFE